MVRPKKKGKSWKNDGLHIMGIIENDNIRIAILLLTDEGKSESTGAVRYQIEVKNQLSLLQRA